MKHRVLIQSNSTAHRRNIYIITENNNVFLASQDATSDNASSLNSNVF